MTYKDSVVQLIKEYHCREVAEIGVFTGVLAKHVLTRCQLARYYLIDPWMPYADERASGKDATLDGWNDICYAVYNEFLWQCPESRIIRLDSVRASYLFKPESLDLVFIDANHTYEAVSADIQAWLPIVRKGGVLAGHDYHCQGGHAGVKKAVDEYLKAVRPLYGGVWYIEKGPE